MPIQPGPGDVHLDQALTDLSVRFTQDHQEFIATKVFPTVNVAFKSDKYFVYSREDWYKTDAQQRAPGTESAGGGYSVSSADYAADVYAFHRDVDDQTRANAQSQISLESDATEFVTQNLLQLRESQWVDNYFKTGVWTTETTLSGVNQWDDYSNSDPLADLRTGVMTLAKGTGKRPNKLVLGAEVWDALQDHPAFLERVKYTEKAILGTDILASLLNIKEVLVPEAIYHEKQEGTSVAMTDYDFRLGKNALFLYVAPNPGINTVSAGYTFNWSGLTGSAGEGIRMKKFRMEAIASDRVEGEMAYDQAVVSADLGYLIIDAVS